jgi:Family of unknown function (DUF5709)
MPDERDYDPDDYDSFDDEGMLDANDTLEGNPGDDPLDAGVITADRWSAGMRFGSTAAEEEQGESLDQLLSEEEPDVFADLDAEDEQPGGADDDEDAGDEDVDGLLLYDGPDPRAGRLVAPDEGAHTPAESDLIARDAGISGGAASAEEAAEHVVEDDDTDIRSGD